MPQRDKTWRLATASLAASGLVAGALAAAAAPAVAASTGGQQLGKHDRELLAQARAEGKSSVTLLIAARPG